MTEFFVALMFAGLTHASGTLQPAFDVKELAAYRLTAPVFQRFQEASRLIADLTRNESAFARSPLFTREIAVTGDAPTMATQLEARLQAHPSIAQVLHSAKITAREYTRFAFALLAARLAHGFVKTGVLRLVPAGVAADNVAFIEAHQAEIAAVLKALGIEGP